MLPHSQQNSKVAKCLNVMFKDPLKREGYRFQGAGAGGRAARRATLGTQTRPIQTGTSRAILSRPVSLQGPSRSTNHFGSQTGGGRGKDQSPTFRYVSGTYSLAPCSSPALSHQEEEEKGT